MAKNGSKNAKKSKKDKVQAKSGAAGVVKAKDKRRKPAALKKVFHETLELQRVGHVSTFDICCLVSYKYKCLCNVIVKNDQK